MKKKVFIGLVAILVVSLILVACGSSRSSYTPPPSPPPKWAGITLNGEDEPLLKGTI